MKTHIIPRGEGKTIKLIKKSAETSDCIVCHSPDEVKRIEDIAKDMGLKITTPITYNDFLHKKYRGGSLKGFLIDNADILLQRISYLPVSDITVSS